MIFPSVGPQTGLILVLPISGVSEVDAPGFACPPAVHNRAILLVARAGDFNPEDDLPAHRAGQHLSMTRVYQPGKEKCRRVYVTRVDNASRRLADLSRRFGDGWAVTRDELF